MANQVYITVIECRVLGTQDKMYGIIARDGYGSAHDIGYTDVDSFYKQYPTKQSLVDWLLTQNGFDGSEYQLVEHWTGSDSGVFPVIVEGHLL